MRRCAVRYDAIICGGGPAGACAAWRLASGGACCILLEASAVPRRKVCGGALGFRARDLLVASGMLTPGDLSAISLREQRAMSFSCGRERLSRYESEGPPILMVDRMDLDALLLSRAEAAGATVLRGALALSLEGSSSVGTTSSGTIRGDFVIAADGAAGRIGRQVRNGRGGAAGFGIETFVPLPDSFPAEIQIHFGLADYGYAWVFPRRDDVCMGIGRMGGRSRPRDLLGELMHLFDRLGVGRPALDRLKAAPIPAGPPPYRMGSGRVLLAGDAAGLADRLTGEGLSHAVESGMLAAESVLNGRGLPWYRREAASGCAGQVRQSALARHLVYGRPFRRLAMRGLARDRRFFDGYWELVSGSSGYAGMIAGFLRGARP